MYENAHIRHSHTRRRRRGTGKRTFVCVSDLHASDGDGDTEYEETQIEWPSICGHTPSFVHLHISRRAIILCVIRFRSEQQCVIFYNIIYLFLFGYTKNFLLSILLIITSVVSLKVRFLSVFLVCGESRVF